jgi:hypothetical protein
MYEATRRRRRPTATATCDGHGDDAEAGGGEIRRRWQRRRGGRRAGGGHSAGRGPLCRFLGFFKKNKFSSPSASTALSESFPECAISGSRGRRLPRGALSRTLFPESCTQGRIPRVQLVFPRVHLAPGEDPVSCSEHPSAVWTTGATVYKTGQQRKELTHRPPCSHN